GHNLLGFVDFSLGAHADAVHHFDRALELSTAVGLGEPGLRRFVPNHVECLLAVGERERAEALLADYEARGRALDRISALGGSARCRALLAAADGDHAAAMAALSESLTQFQRGGFPFDQALTLLVEGRLRRRAREKRAAKDALQGALDLFDELGARGWADQTRDELGRIGLRPAAPLHLTATEQRVAELIGGGMSTREVAGALFLSPKTVEANLTRIYRKLGIRTRAELGSWLTRDASPHA
ncbi:MAG: helix-turn-helix transcriptional regulator, partial [Acidimicrobiales bacterium]